MCSMNILISNDDGIHAPGIMTLYNAVKDLGDVHVVAPDSERSAVGHAITLSDPLKTIEVYRDGSWFGHAVSGTPADCVKLAVCGLLENPPDLILSGVNFGANTGISIIYSGTVSAATEGTILGIPSVAVSLTTFTDPIWETAAHVARVIALQTARHGLPADTLLNVNVPNLPVDQLKGYAVTRMGRSRFVETFEKRSDPRGNIYYWMDGEMELLDGGADTDVQAVLDGYVSLSPIGLDLTRHDGLDVLRQWEFQP